ncbi:DUF2267 domain-containing protein [Streptomyces cellulosae]|uniref:DUF2267 domain-containing protein n=1 Tax=Streptomyces cellulosae TaxID=1968 RepID=A0ABW7YFY3_STRCE
MELATGGATCEGGEFECGYDGFVASVRDRGEYPTPNEAEQVTVAVLKVLASRLTAGGAKDLAAQRTFAGWQQAVEPRSGRRSRPPCRSWAATQEAALPRWTKPKQWHRGRR